MSEYKELVKDLNDLQELPPMECVEEYHNAHDRKLYGRAASELERLAFTREAWVGAAEDYVRRAEAAEKELKATQLVCLHLINELEEIASYDTTSECDEFEEEGQVEADVLIKRARSALEAKP